MQYDQFSRYRIVSKLGEGQMGIVYLAHDPEIDRRIALKVLRRELVSDGDPLNRFANESRVIGRLSHPNIVTVYDVGHDHGTVFIAMELLKGASLEKFVSDQGLPVADVVRIGVQIADALDYAHQRGVIHRDIKPGNIIVTQDLQVKLTDFGIARLDDPAANLQTQAGDILGTPSYMSAEQVQGKTVDGRSDLYALGVILYELCCGRRPFTGSNLSAVFLAIAKDVPRPLKELAPAVPTVLADVIMKCLQKNPDDRYPSGRALVVALKTCRPQQDTDNFSKDTVRIAMGGSPKKVSRTIRTMVWIICVALLLVVGTIGYVYRDMVIPPASQDLPPVAPPPSADLQDEVIEQRMASLNIVSVPPQVAIFINGEAHGDTPATLELPLGAYDILLQLSGYYDWEAKLTLEEEGPIPLSVRMIAEE
jgi:serine/threonine protein kinase